MKKVVDSKAVSSDVKQDAPQPEASKITYDIEHINQVLGFLGQQKFAEVAGLVEILKTKGELS
tara:strand:+ start:194 stop:382 length:189 start_codon:yes stop_codon:yes gene_type:complete